MKFFLSLVSLVVIVVYSSFSQDSHFGLKGGLNLSSLGGDAEGVTMRPGYHFGLMGTYELNDEFSIQPEFVFSSQGAMSEDDSDVIFRYQYFNFPILFRYRLKEAYFILGPQPGILFNAVAKNKRIDKKSNVSVQLDNFDFAISAGIGTYLDDHLGLEARFNFGITNSSEISDGEYFPNRVLQFSIFYKL